MVRGDANARLDGGLGDLREGHAPRPIRLQAGSFRDVPGDGLALAVEVGGQVDDVRRRRGLVDGGQLFASVGHDFVDGLEVVVHVHSQLALAGVLRQVADMAVGREHGVAGPEVALDRFRLGGRFDDNEVAAHPRESSISHSRASCSARRWAGPWAVPAEISRRTRRSRARGRAPPRLRFPPDGSRAT